MRQARAPCIALVEAAPQLLEVRLAMLSEAMQKGAGSSSLRAASARQKRPGLPPQSSALTFQNS